MLDPLSASPTKWSNKLKQFVGNFPTNCLNVFDHFVGLALKGLILKAKFSNDSLFGVVLVWSTNLFEALQIKAMSK